MLFCVTLFTNIRTNPINIANSSARTNIEKFLNYFWLNYKKCKNK